MQSIAKSNINKILKPRIFLPVVLAIFLILTVVSAGAAESMLGDVNGDGVIDVRDVVLVQRHILGKITLTAEQFKAADINGDGLVDARDVTLIMQHTIGKISTFPLQVGKIDDLNLSVNFGTPYSSINFPATVSATISDGTKRDISVKWDEASTPVYNAFTAGTYVFKGNLHDLPSGITNPDGLKATANVNVSSAWIPPQPVVFQVSFNAQGGTPNPASIFVAFGSSYGTLPTVTRTGYTFNGWYTSSTGGTLVTPSTVVFIAANHTLYAQWTAIIPTGKVWNQNSDQFYDKIQEAINDADEGDAIYVGTGIFKETINLNVEGLILRSLTGAVNTTIRGGGGSGIADAVVYFGADNVTLEGFTIDRDDVLADSRAIGPGSSVGATIKNNIIIDAFRGVQGDWYGTPTNLKIVGNAFYTEYGIAGTEEMTGLVVTGNNFVAGDPVYMVEGVGLGEGVQIFGLAPLAVDNKANYISYLVNNNDFDDSLNTVAHYAIGDYVNGSPDKYSYNGTLISP
jgi:uncharacterized repeat protein (TIGR02543 family)